MIRGSLGNYEFLNIEVAQSSYCVACSPSVIHRYQTEEDFIQKCIESPDYLMEVVGLSEMDINADDIIEISD